MPVILYSAKIIEGPSPSRFALAATEGGVAEFTLRLTLLSNGRLAHEERTTNVSLADMDRVPCADGTYRIRDDRWILRYDPFRCDGYIANIDELSVDSIT